MAKIPNQLRQEEFRFVKIPRARKNPIEEKWATENNYRYDDPELLEHLADGGNYGVVCGYGDMCVIDCDSEEVSEAVTKNLPETMVGRTGGGGLHFYYIVPDMNRPIRLSSQKKGKAGDVGDVQWMGKQVVGPSSLHPNGNLYKIELDSEITTTSREDIGNALSEWVVGERKKRWSPFVYEEGSFKDLGIEDLVDLSRLKKRGEEYYGGHPIHGSTTGQNFWVNAEKNCYHCFRHSAGGGPLHWLAVREGIVGCDSAHRVFEDSEILNRTLSIAKELFPVKKSEDERRWRFGPIGIRAKCVQGGWNLYFEDEEGAVGRPLDIPFKAGLNDYYQNKLRRRLEEPFKYEFVKKPEDFEFGKAFVQLVSRMKLPSPSAEKEVKEEKEPRNERAEELLGSPQLITRISGVIHDHLAGETKNSLLLLLVYLSALTDSPNVLRPTGESSIGKSFLATRVARLLPDEMKIIRKGFSEMAVWNKGEPTDEEDRRIWDVRGKVMIILEEETSEEFLKQFRPILAHDEDMITYEVTDTESKSRKTLKVDIIGWPSYVGIRIGGRMDEQEVTRAMTMTPDAGKEKYSRAIWWHAEKDSTPWERGQRDERTELMRKAIGLLKSYHVFIPQLVAIQKHFPRFRGRHMRDWRQFVGLVKAVTVLHQFQRPVLEIDDEKYLITAPTDVETAVRISEGALSETLRGLGTREQRFWSFLMEETKDVGYVEGYRELMDLYKRCFGEESSETTIRRKYVYKLADEGLLEVEEGRGNKAHKFFPTGSLSTISTNFEKIIDSAINCDFKDTKLSDLSTTKNGVQDTPSVCISNCDDFCGQNPVENPTKEQLKELWGSLHTPNLVVDNSQVLKKGYKEDYGGEESFKDLVLMVDKKPEKEDSGAISVGELIKNAQKVGKGAPEFEHEIAQKLLWGGPMTVEEVRSELDIEDTQFNEAFNRLAERGEIVQRGGKWVHRENILGEP